MVDPVLTLFLAFLGALAYSITKLWPPTPENIQRIAQHLLAAIIIGCLLAFLPEAVPELGFIEPPTKFMAFVAGWFSMDLLGKLAKKVEGTASKPPAEW